MNQFWSNPIFRPLASKFSLLFVSLCAVYFTTAQSAYAQQSIPVKLVDGALVAQCTLKSATGHEMPANVVIDLGWRSPLVLHMQTAGALELDKDPRVDVIFPDFKLLNLKPPAKPLENLEILTRDFGPQLGEIPAVAMMGLNAFADRTVQLDLAAGVLRLWDGDGPGKFNAGNMDKDARLNITEYEMQPGGLVIYGSSDITDPFTILLTTQRTGSVLDSKILKKALLPDGSLRPFFVGKLNLPDYCPFQPTKYEEAMPFKPSVVVGTSALSNFRITIEQSANRVIWEQVKDPSVNPDDQRVMISIFRHDVAGLESYLAKYGNSRLAREAADELVEERFNEEPLDKEACARAVKYYAATVPPERRARSLIIMVDNFLQDRDPGQIAIAEKILEFATDAQNLDVDAAAVHAIHARQGFIAMLKKDYKTARRMLLAAAFGLPRDPTINLWLGELYQKTNLPLRAWSRYTEAALAQDPLIDAFKAIDDMMRDPETRKKLPMRELEVLLDGRIPAFIPPRAKNVRAPEGLQLVEFFSSVNKEDTLGAELAFRGLELHYAGTEPVFVLHSLDRTLGNDFVNKQAKLYGVDKSPALVVNGAVLSRKGAKAADAPALFEEFLKDVSDLPTASVTGKLQAAATCDAKGFISLHLQAQFPAEKQSQLRVFALLTERCVFAVGANYGVLHYSVSRGNLGPADGFSLSAEPITWRGNFNDFEKSLDTWWQNQPIEEGKWRMRPTLLDRKDISIVLYMQDLQSKQILAAQRIPIRFEGDSHE